MNLDSFLVFYRWTVQIFIVGPTEIKKSFLGCGIFSQISQYMRNQWLKTHLLASLDLLNMINGSDCDCGTQKVGFQSKNGNLRMTAPFIVHPQLCNCFSTVDDQRSSIFCRFFMIHDKSGFDCIAILVLLKRVSNSDFAKVAHRNPELMIQHSGLFCKYPKIY